MKVLGLLSLFLLLGCVSTQDLIEQAHLSGDWTPVNLRLTAIEKRQAEKAAEQSCGRGSIMYCSKRFGEEKCACAGDAELRRALGAFGH